MVTAYPVLGKAKSAEICRAFADGCGGAVASHSAELVDGPAFFYGVDESNAHLYRQARSRGNYFYSDNAFFDSTRQSHFRIAKDRLQHSGDGSSNGERLKALGIEIKPWRVQGLHIVVCPQSDQFMQTVVGYKNGDWAANTIADLKANTAREIRVRPWNRDKTKLAATLAADLVNAHALVTWSSAAAVTAVLAGIPVVSMSPESAAFIMSGTITRLHSLPTPEREQWAGVLADNQWTIAEMRDGTAWRALQ